VLGKRQQPRHLRLTRTLSAKRDALLVKWWPAVSATALFLVLVALIGPWSELPINDDWQYAHVAKSLAEKATLTVDVPIAPTVVGQSLMAFPVIRALGFSHLALRFLTMTLSILILFELGYLLSISAVPGGLQFVALANVVANPLFLHLSTSFMTENYAYFVGLLGACIWFYGRNRHPVASGVIAAAIVGFAFWIRQFSALVLPALILAELISARVGSRSLRPLAIRWSASLGVFAVSVAAYFAWATSTGNFTSAFSGPLGSALSPDPLSILVELGVFLFYVTFFFAPFLVAFIRREKPSVGALLIPALLAASAGFALALGDWTGSPRASLHPTFPFLHNLLTEYGVGPITLTDVYWNNAQTRPSVSAAPWIILEVVMIILSFAWFRVFALVKEQKNELAIFGICLAVLSFTAVAISFRYAILDRYHYPALLAFTVAIAVLFPRGSERRLYRAAVLWIGCLGLFSTLSLHDYFRWNEVRVDLVREAQRRGIALSQLDGGYEVNGWNDVERIATSAGCGVKVVWFCDDRPFRIGLEQKASDSLILSQPVDAWLVRFPDIKLIQRR
jgi:hypothetical protein